MKPTIENTILRERDLGKAIKMLRRNIDRLDFKEGLERMDSLESDYMLMCRCFKHGMRDPQGEDMYNSLLYRAYQLYGDVRLESIICLRHAYAGCKDAASGICGSVDSIRETLENYVQDLAMATLLPEERQAETVRKCRDSHQEYMNRLFCWLVVARQWSREESDRFARLILSPTVDGCDALMAVSGLTLSLLTVFDPNKWHTLVTVFETATAEALRQRALVGLVLSLPEGETGFFADVTEALHRVCMSDDNRRQILELQVQMYYCVRAEDDNREIQRDIMPTLIKNSGKYTPNNPMGDSADNIDDILGNEDVDNKMEELESKVKKMKDMLNSGSDVFFGGFAKMKRFAFFDRMSNWFAPFSLDNPALATVTDRMEMSFVRNVTSHLNICDSDRYSFVFALAIIIGRLPGGMKEMMANGNVMMASSDIDTESASYIRRMYLQDMYRFYMLYRDNGAFFNPFARGTHDGSSSPAFLFMKKPQLRELLAAEVSEAAQIMFGQGRYDLSVELLTVGRAADGLDSKAMLVLGYSYLRLGKYDEAYEVLAKLYARGDNSLQTVKGLADALFMQRNYVEAVAAYETLMSSGHSSRSLIVNHSLALINTGKIKEGMAQLYRLDYEDSSCIEVKRALAWGLIAGKNAADAERMYRQIIDGGCFIAADLLNCGYALWGQSRIEDAAKMFARYKSNEGVDIESDFVSDAPVLNVYGIKDYERKMMLDFI